ncbi:MAG: PaaI family thioesterase [Acidimicrobiales bacterium]
MDTPVGKPKPAFTPLDPSRVIGRGHPAGDFLEAYDWRVLDEDEGRIRIEAHLPPQVLNPRRHLFGGFTGTYVDLVVLTTVRSGPSRADLSIPRDWLMTTNMRLDYLAPITGPTFTIDSQVEYRGGRSRLVSTRFYQGDTLAVIAMTTVLQVPDPATT